MAIMRMTKNGFFYTTSDFTGEVINEEEGQFTLVYSKGLDDTITPYVGEGSWLASDGKLFNEWGLKIQEGLKGTDYENVNFLMGFNHTEGPWFGVWRVLYEDELSEIIDLLIGEALCSSDEEEQLDSGCV